MATITDEDREAAHAIAGLRMAGLRMDGWCSWTGADVHGEQCDAIAQLAADARERENKACEAETELRAVPLRDWFLRFVPGGVPSVPAELVQCAQRMLDRVEAIRDAIRSRRST